VVYIAKQLISFRKKKKNNIRSGTTIIEISCIKRTKVNNSMYVYKIINRTGYLAAHPRYPNFSK
jgi:hypothetical protein